MIPLLFWDVDTQVDFMKPDGKLYVPEAESLIANLAALTTAARRHGIPVLASADDHEPSDTELSDQPDFRQTFPPHCLRGTPGVERIPETAWPEARSIGHEPLSVAQIREAVAGEAPVLLVHKKRFDVFTNPNTEALVAALDPGRIVLYGVALDVCDRYAVEGLLTRGHRGLELVVDATKPIRAADAPALLERWRECGVKMVTTAEVVTSVSEAARAAIRSGSAGRGRGSRAGR